MSCKPSCRLCDNLVISRSVTVVTVAGVPTLVIDLPARTYMNGCKYCIIVAQTIPATATINMPVAFSINGVTTTVYPFVRCNCSQITACGIRTRTRYSTIVSTTATGGVFKSLGGICCCPNNNLLSLPVVTTTTAPAATPAVASLSTDEPVVANAKVPNKTTKTVTTTTKEVLANE
ncbi:MAG: hypothetical protein ACI4PF_02340 [Christensenellales bacterium]